MITTLYILFITTLNSFQIENKLNLQFERAYQWHSTDFRTIDSTPTCCFNISDGVSLSNGVLLNYKIKVYDKLYVGSGLSFKRYNGKVNSFLNEEISIEGVNYLGKFEYAVENQFDLLNFDLTVDYNVFNNMYLGINIGINRLVNFKYYQYEKLVNPSNKGYFLQEDGRRTRLNNEYKGELNQQSINFNLGLNVSYELPLNKKQTLNLLPIIGYNFFIGELISDTDWSFKSLNLSMGLNYYFHKDTSDKKYDKNIDKTILIAPVIISKGKEVFRNELEYKIVNYKIEIIDFELTEKIKKVEFTKKTPNDDILRLFYKYGKFNNIQKLELETTYEGIQSQRNLDLSSDKIDFKIDNLLDYYDDKITYNLKLTDKQKVYSKGNYTIEEKTYYSNSISIKLNKIDDMTYNIKLMKWKGETEQNRIYSLIKENIEDLDKIKSIQSNSEYGLKLIQELDNPKILYNDNEELIKKLKSFLGNDYYIILNEN